MVDKLCGNVDRLLGKNRPFWGFIFAVSVKKNYPPNPALMQGKSLVFTTPHRLKNTYFFTLFFI